MLLSFRAVLYCGTARLFCSAARLDYSSVLDWMEKLIGDSLVSRLQISLLMTLINIRIFRQEFIMVLLRLRRMVVI